MTDDPARDPQEVERRIAEWYDAPQGSPIVRKPLHEHVGMTLAEWVEWMGRGND